MYIKTAPNEERDIHFKVSMFYFKVILMDSLLIKFMFAIVASIFSTIMPISVGGIGVNYGRVADNLPPPKQVIDLYKRCGIRSLHLYDPTDNVLEALKGSDLQVSIGIKSEDLQTLATNPVIANQWVNYNVAPYANDIRFQWITVGNDAIPGPDAKSVPQAMQNIQNAIYTMVGPTSGIKVTTAISMAGLKYTHLPSKGVFSDEIVETMKRVSSFLVKTEAPLIIHVYPYKVYASDHQNNSFNYAAFLPVDQPVVDGDLEYHNLFTAMVDVFNAAMEKIGFGNVTLFVGETGWPTKGNEPYTSKISALIYNKNLINFIEYGHGTPRKPGQAMQAFIFSMFNENKREGTVERNWGLFNYDMSPVYSLFNC